MNLSGRQRLNPRPVEHGAVICATTAATNANAMFTLVFTPPRRTRPVNIAPESTKALDFQGFRFIAGAGFEPATFGL
jgi:hypothetical protein